MNKLDTPVASMADELKSNFANLSDWQECWGILRELGHSHSEIDRYLDDAMAYARELSEGQERAA
ncbi:hypothetical protein [Chelatococcus sp. YT9]|uniref:hypothetical protein n=1 Tax=Chelatococcus sp. YT9 TaxID=2835635 RepID=UPI001BCAA716|nr:hypothetical protein [Chelatococcus sp. YT9]MBS7698579.1 hypothetical protein [Chelatococcus sp. YT9]